MDWTEEYFDDIYLKYFLLQQDEARTKAQVDFIEKFLKPKFYVLDAGCGIGRHSIELAKRGYSVLGVDSNSKYIEIARNRKNDLNLMNVNFEALDMRNLNFLEKFDAVINMWSSFGYFDDESNKKILINFFNALKKDGILILDIENRDYILKYFIRETFKEKEGGVFILERRKFNPINSVVSTHRYIVGPNLRKDYIRHVRIYSLTEIINLFKEVGFKQIEYFGNYNFEKFHVDSERIIAVGKK